MHRHPLISLLENYRLKHPAEDTVCQRYLDFVRTHPDCFDRSLRSGHVTGSAWIVNPEGTETLLTHHKKLNRWLQLGGHADGQTDVAAAALREAREESGLKEFTFYSPGIFDLDIHLIPARNNEPDHFHYDARFVLVAMGSRELSVSDESHDLKWVPLDSLENFTREESMLRMRHKWLEIRSDGEHAPAKTH